MSEELYEGEIHAIKSGNAFFKSKELGEDIFIHSEHLKGALHLDIVKISIIEDEYFNKAGVVHEIVKRFRETLVGTYQDNIVIPLSHKISENIIIPPTKNNNAKKNDKVIVKITHWGGNLYGEIVSVIGPSYDNDVEIKSILYEHDIHDDFPSEVYQELKNIVSQIPQNEIKHRDDFRMIPTFTIDPEDAKDFDDAISFQNLPNGEYQVGIHIADVSYYVKPFTELDREAVKRGTSVYLVDRVIPMLPEKLSNDICSLKPNEDKLVLSVIFNIDRTGKIKKYYIREGIINSNLRLTYNEAQEIIDTKIHELPKKFQRYGLEIKALSYIAQMLREDRLNDGSLEIYQNKYQIKLNQNKKPIAININKPLKSQQLIEEFMLLANKTIAEWVNKHKVPNINRIHEKPDETKLVKLKGFLNNFDIELDLNNPRESLIEILKESKDKPYEAIINNLVSSSMEKAVYSTKNIGHFGLNFNHYSHFTSPIRRYPDLILHRLIKVYLKGKFDIKLPKLEERCKHLSSCERRAKKAERDSIRYKQLEFMESRIGNVYDGFITHITNQYLFVELYGIGVSVIVYISNSNKYTVADVGDKKILFDTEKDVNYQITDNIKIKIKDVDFNTREIFGVIW